MFELSLNDSRYLPFEYMGAVSRWSIELPQENNYFDMDTLTDAILTSITGLGKEAPCFATPHRKPYVTSFPAMAYRF